MVILMNEESHFTSTCSFILFSQFHTLKAALPDFPDRMNLELRKMRIVRLILLTVKMTCETSIAIDKYSTQPFYSNPSAYYFWTSSIPPPCVGTMNYLH